MMARALYLSLPRRQERDKKPIHRVSTIGKIEENTEKTSVFLVAMQNLQKFLKEKLHVQFLPDTISTVGL